MSWKHPSTHPIISGVLHSALHDAFSIISCSQYCLMTLKVKNSFKIPQISVSLYELGFWLALCSVTHKWHKPQAAGLRMHRCRYMNLYTIHNGNILVFKNNCISSFLILLIRLILFSSRSILLSLFLCSWPY